MFRKIYSKLHFSNILMIMISRLYLFYQIKIKNNHNYKNLLIKKEKDKNYLIYDGISKFKIHNLNKLPRYYRGFKFSQKGTIEGYGFNKYFFLPKGANVLNVGANIGEVALGFLENNFNVVAVKADKIQFNILKDNKNFFLDNKNVKLFFDIFNVALSNDTGIKEFYSRPIDNDSTLVKPKKIDEGKYKKEIINTYTIDDLLYKYNIDLIIGDVEGHEPEILIGATNTLKKCKYVALDCVEKENNIDTIDRTIEVLKSNNFKIIKRPEKFNRSVVIAQNNFIS